LVPRPGIRPPLGRRGGALQRHDEREHDYPHRRSIMHVRRRQVQAIWIGQPVGRVRTDMFRRYRPTWRRDSRCRKRRTSSPCAGTTPALKSSSGPPWRFRTDPLDRQLLHYWLRPCAAAGPGESV